MKLKLKALAAAVALVAGIGSANAAIDGFAGGNGSLVFFIADTNAGTSAMFDLGYNVDSFLPTNAVGQSWNLAASTNNQGVAVSYGTAWDDYVASANLANSVWGVIAGDSLGSGTGQRRYLSTSNDPSTTVGSLTNAKLGTFSTVDTFLNTSNAYGNHASVANGADVVTASDGNAYYASGMGPKWKNNATFNAVTNTADSMDFYFLTNSSTSGLAKASYQQYVGTWSIDAANGSLVYAVPEPGTWAMLAAGLLIVGGIARRRMSV